MASKDRKPEKAESRKDKQHDEKIADLPSREQTAKDAKVKGGAMKKTY